MAAISLRYFNSLFSLFFSVLPLQIVKSITSSQPFLFSLPSDFTTLSVKIHFKIILELFLSTKGKKMCEPGAHLCFFPEILAVIINNMSHIFKQRYYRVESKLRFVLTQTFFTYKNNKLYKFHPETIILRLNS